MKVNNETGLRKIIIILLYYNVKVCFLKRIKRAICYKILRSEYFTYIYISLHLQTFYNYDKRSQFNYGQLYNFTGIDNGTEKLPNFHRNYSLETRLFV